MKKFFVLLAILFAFCENASAGPIENVQIILKNHSTFSLSDNFTMKISDLVIGSSQFIDPQTELLNVTLFNDFSTPYLFNSDDSEFCSIRIFYGPTGALYTDIDNLNGRCIAMSSMGKSSLLDVELYDNPSISNPHKIKSSVN